MFARVKGNYFGSFHFTACPGPPKSQGGACCPSGSGSVSGDPHVKSLRGARYTLFKEGTFNAWNFAKVTRILIIIRVFSFCLLAEKETKYALVTQSSAFLSAFLLHQFFLVRVAAIYALKPRIPIEDGLAKGGESAVAVVCSVFRSDAGPFANMCFFLLGN